MLIGSMESPSTTLPNICIESFLTEEVGTRASSDANTDRFGAGDRFHSVDKSLETY